MKYEDLLEEVGSFGRFQKLLCFTLIPLTTGLCGLTYYTQIFILTAPDHLCRQSFNQTLNDAVLDLSINRWNLSHQGLSANESFDRDKFVCNQYSSEDLEAIINGGTNASEFAGPMQECQNGWHYDYDSLFPTVTSQNDWVCDSAWKPYVIVTCFWIGNTIGAWILGALSDRYGRRPTIGAALLVYGAAGVGSAFVTEYFYGFLILRILVGSAHHTVSHLPFILVVEYCGISSRVVPLFTIMATYTLASILAPLLALTIWEWKTLALVTSVPALFMLILYRWLPESASWMMTKGKRTLAIEQLEKVSKMNKIPKSKEFLSQKIDLLTSAGSSSEKVIEKQHNASASLLQIFKFPRLSLNVLVVLFIWMISCMSFYGHCQNTANIGSDIFWSYLIGATIEIPSWGVPYFIQKFGRKPTLIVAYLFSGLAGVVHTLLPIKFENTSFAFALLARLFITGAYYITLQYGPEIFPTVVRGRGVAMSETLGGIAIFVSPLIVYLGEIQRNLPIAIFSIISIVGGFATLILPETKGKALPQTMEEAELFAKHAGPKCCFKRSKEKEIHLDR